MNTEFIIEPNKAGRRYWLELWQFRELFYVLAWRDLAVRYKQTAIGILWAGIQPLAQMAILVVVFGVMAKLPSQGGAPYVLLVFAAMLPWQFFAASLSAASMSMVSNAALISKVYFPRVIVPVAAVVTCVVDLLVALGILAVLMLLYGYAPTWRIVTLPFFMVLAFVAAIGPGLLITALNVEYRDFRYVVPFLVQFGLYLSPVGFSSEVVRRTFGEAVYLIYSLNPMVGVIEGFRWAILGGDVQIDGVGFVLSVTLSMAILVLGLRYFRRVEHSIVDVI